ncbi:GNAT family N-acetyltransferase [Formosa undariae]|uniref:GNAT family N-acetyltransferase n=1 Tax=Formosa undariae TaxID=1325436 RepID=A0ABV5EYA9_9FLAO
MEIFETERLIIRGLEEVDKKYFAELFTDPIVLEGIPQKAFTPIQITERFNKSRNLTLRDLSDQKCACAIFEKGNEEMIGLALFLINEHDEKELGYRFRVDYWGKGYGTETTKGMLKYYFQEMNENKVTADVNIANISSVKILEKFMKPVRQFFNERDNCIDRTYELTKENWIKQK